MHLVEKYKYRKKLHNKLTSEEIHGVGLPQHVPITNTSIWRLYIYIITVKT